MTIGNKKNTTRYTLHATRSNGFTLIETIIYMGLLAIMLLIVTNLLITTSYFSQEENARLEIQKNGRFALERIVRDLQISDNVIVPADSNPTENLDLGGVSYQLSGDQLQRTDLAGAENVISNQVKIDSLQFTRIENAGGGITIKIEMTIDYIGEIESKQNISQDFNTTYYLK